MDNFEILIPIVLFLAIAFVIKTAIEHKTWRLLINKGGIDEQSQLSLQRLLQAKAPQSLKWGMVLVGVGLAFLISQFMPYQLRDELTVGFMFIFAGLALIGFYAFDKKYKEQADKP